MSTVGIIMLVHTALGRAERVARHWAADGCPVVIHVDSSVKPKAYKKFVKALENEPDVRFCKRHKCEWGDWGLVAASQSAGETMLAEFPDVRHIYLSSGSCLPLRPVQELKDYLIERETRRFARALVSRLFEYGTGRSVTFSDHETLETLTDHFESADYRLSDLIVAIIQCEDFQSK